MPLWCCLGRGAPRCGVAKYQAKICYIVTVLPLVSQCVLYFSTMLQNSSLMTKKHGTCPSHLIKKLNIQSILKYSKYCFNCIFWPTYSNPACVCQVILPNFVAVASNLIPQLCEFWGYVLASKEALSVVHLYNYTLYKIHNQQLCDLTHHLKKKSKCIFCHIQKITHSFLMNFSTSNWWTSNSL